MSQRTGEPNELCRRILGVDVAWKVGFLNQQPNLEIPKADQEYLEAMNKYSETYDDEKYLEFHKYQNSISETFGEIITRKTKGKNYICIYVYMNCIFSWFSSYFYLDNRQVFFGQHIFLYLHIFSSDFRWLFLLIIRCILRCQKIEDHYFFRPVPTIKRDSTK